MTDPKPLRAFESAAGPNPPTVPVAGLQRAVAGPGAASSRVAAGKGPPDCAPRSGGPTYPHVLSHEPSSRGTVLVTFALPGLRRATIRVPFDAWLNGERLVIGRSLAERHPADVPLPDPFKSRMTDTVPDRVSLDDYEPPS